MPTKDEEDRDAKRKAHEERRKHSGTSSSTRMGSSDRRGKDRARKGGDTSRSSAPGAFASTENSPRSTKLSGKSRSSDKSSDAIDRSERHSSSKSEGKNSRSSGKSRTSKPATVPGAVTSSEGSRPSPGKHRTSKPASVPGAVTSSKGVDRPSSGKHRTSKPASVPGAVTSSASSSPHSRRERRKAGNEDNSSRSRRTTPRSNTDAVQQKLSAAGLLDEEEGEKELQSKSIEPNTNEEGEVLLEAQAVDENETKPPVQREVGFIGEELENKEPPPERKKRPVGLILFAVLLLGACAAAGAYFGTRGTSEDALPPDSTTSSPTASNATSAPSTSPPTAPPSKAFKYPPPNEEACQRVATGNDRMNQTETFTRNHELEMDVELSNEEIDLDLEALQKAMQERFMPALAGCSDVVVRQLEIRYVIFQGIVGLSLLEDESCVLDHSGPCYVVVAGLTLQLQGQEISRSINNVIEDVLGTDDLVALWELQSPFFSPYSRLSVTEIRSVDQTLAPSDNPTAVLSAPPTLAPSFATFGKPSSAPVIDGVTTTSSPTSPPSVTQTTPAPTLTMSENPTVAPVIGPTTEEPTKLPSDMPSKIPSTTPSSLPTPNPTTIAPTTTAPTTTAPTPLPSTMPSSGPTFELMEGDPLLNEHYVYYMPDDRLVYPYSSHEEGQAACESKGLTLCSTSAISNYPLCSIGWLTDGRGLWSNGNGCGFGGFTDGDFFGISGIGGAYCCGRPYYMPETREYIYYSREEGLAACQTKGMGLCSVEQITGYELCSYGWLSDDVGLWMKNDDYAPGELDDGPTPEPSTMPSSGPTFKLMEGDHLLNEHYVYYMPEDRLVYPYSSREEGQAACESKGLALCSTSAITNYPLCSIGWLTDGRGLWSEGNGCGFGGFTDGDFFGISGIGGAYCCGRPYYMPETREYIYDSREEGLAACQTKGMGLCSVEQITGYELCSYGWLSDDVGLWMNSPIQTPGCGTGGFDRTIFPNNGAYCCVVPP
ncbi:MAG: hypothetical protein SGBAC_009060 [Bacillariaceae sp.]